jgi:hypothetical protein
VAGRRSSDAAGIEHFVHEVLDEMLAKSSKKNVPMTWRER